MRRFSLLCFYIELAVLFSAILSEVIAAHAWFDIAAGVASYLADPEDNPLGAKVSFLF